MNSLPSLMTVLIHLYFYIVATTLILSVLFGFLLLLGVVYFLQNIPHFIIVFRMFILKYIIINYCLALFLNNIFLWYNRYIPIQNNLEQQLQILTCIKCFSIEKIETNFTPSVKEDKVLIIKNYEFLFLEKKMS